jgi:hypothetical protein
MESISLCDYHSDMIKIYVTAYLEEGKLRIESQDLGATVSSVWGDDEYEYFCYLSVEDTKRLHLLLEKKAGLKKGLLVLVKEYFSGTEGCSEFREYCKLNDIPYSEFSC